MERKEELFVLKWENFRYNISNNFSSLRHSSQFQDVTLYIDKEHSVSAHKVILASCSSYFQNLLSELTPASSPHPIIVMPQGLGHMELVHMLDYMYHGEVSLPESQLQRFMDVAEQFQVLGLNKDSAGQARPRAQKCQEPQRSRRPSQPMKSVGLLCPGCSLMCKDVPALKAHMAHECSARQEQSDSSAGRRPIGSVAPHTRPAGASPQEKNRQRIPMPKFSSGGASRQHQSIPRRGLEVPSTRQGPAPSRYAPAPAAPPRHSPAPPTQKRRRPGQGQDLASNLSQRFGGGISVSAVSSQKKARVEVEEEEEEEEEEEVEVGDVKEEPKDYYEEEQKDFVTAEDDGDMMGHEEGEYYAEEEVDDAAYVEGEEEEEEQDHEPGFPGYDYYGHA